jgi:hypothetical protein
MGEVRLNPMAAPKVSSSQEIALAPIAPAITALHST